MKDLVLHPLTRRYVEQFVSQPSHAVMLTGPAGSGKFSVAKSLAEAVLQLDDLTGYPYQMTIAAEEGKSLGIEPIRELEHFLSLKVPRAGLFNRLIIIKDGHALTPEAQNALLKTIEEPPTGTLIIVNTDYEQALLPTVRSRAQVIPLKSPEKTALTKHFNALGHDHKQVAQAYSISGGLPGLMTALLASEDHPLLNATKQARELLSASAYERLLKVDELAKQKPLALDTVFILQQMAHVSLQTATGLAAKRWQKVLTASFKATTDLNGNAQPKLALSSLCLSL